MSARLRFRCPRRALRALSACLVVLLLQGCAWLVPAQDAPVAVSPDVVRGISDTLAARSAAVRAGRAQRFVRTVTPGPVRAQQRVWFTNLRQLPLQGFRQQLLGSPREVEGGYQARVRTWTRLRGFDRAAVPTDTEVTFAASARGWQITSSTPVGGVAQPWDSGAVALARAPGVLVIGDLQSAGSLSTVAESVQRARASITRQVPWRWSEAVVVQAPSTVAPLANRGNLPGGDATRLDGITYRVAGGPDGSRLAGRRVLLHPRMLKATEAVRGRLLRHELTHVALGERNERIPMWLSEGIAEYAATRDLPRAERTIGRVASLAARAGVARLPSDQEFRAEASATQYAVSWFACEAVAQRQGSAAPWRLVDQMAGRGSESVDALLVRVTGGNGVDLAGRARAALLATYR